MSGKRILLIVGGGIAAYKACELIRLLRKAGAEVQVVLSAGGARFITPVTLQALSGHPVRQSLWDEDAEAAMGHIELSRWADLVVVAPATAGLIAKAAATKSHCGIGRPASGRSAECRLCPFSQAPKMPPMMKLRTSGSVTI